MIEKRVADLINLKIIKKTGQVFPDEIVVLRAGTNFMRRLAETSKKALPNQAVEWAFRKR